MLQMTPPWKTYNKPGKELIFNGNETVFSTSFALLLKDYVKILEEMVTAEQIGRSS